MVGRGVAHLADSSGGEEPGADHKRDDAVGSAVVAPRQRSRRAKPVDSRSAACGRDDWLSHRRRIGPWRLGGPHDRQRGRSSRIATAEACWLDWISKAEGKDCIRRVDSTKHYPEDMTGLSHTDGEIWSSALWHMRGALGDLLSGRIIIDAQFDFTNDITFSTGAAKTIAAALRLGGPTAAAAVRTAFADRGIV